MALTLEVTTDLQSQDLPTGYTNPATTISFSDPEEVSFEYTVAIAGIAHAATAATGIGALITAVNSWLTTTFIPATLGIDVTNTVSAIATVRAISRRNSGYAIGSNPAIFVIGTDQYIVRGKLKWEIS